MAMIDLRKTTHTGAVGIVARRDGKRHESSFFPARKFARKICVVTVVAITWQAREHGAFATPAEDDNAATQTDARQSATIDKADKPRTPDHGDPFSVVLLELSVIIVLAMVGRWIAVRFDWPGVLGKLASGIVVGNIGYWLGTPVYVLVMHRGMQVKLAALCQPSTLWLAVFLVLSAIVGKLFAGLRGGRAVDRLAIGMLPRGEVGLIFASIGRSFGVVGASVFSTVVVMEVVTTLVTPIALKRRLDQQQ